MWEGDERQSLTLLCTSFHTSLWMAFSSALISASNKAQETLGDCHQGFCSCPESSPLCLQAQSTYLCNGFSCRL